MIRLKPRLALIVRRRIRRRIIILILRTLRTNDGYNKISRAIARTPGSLVV